MGNDDIKDKKVQNQDNKENSESKEKGGEDSKEVTLDLSKLAFWSKKKKEAKPGKEEKESGHEKKEDAKESRREEQKNDKAKKEAKKHAKKSDDNEEGSDISFDIKNAMSFAKKYSAVLLILIPIIIMIFFRSYPMNLPATDDWARDSVQNYYKGQIGQQIAQQYPNLPDQNKNDLIEEQFQEYLKTNKAQIDEQIKQTSIAFKNQLQDENGYTYLADIDSYSWLGEARNVADHGYIGDELLTGQEVMDKGVPGQFNPTKKYNYNSHMFAPIGTVSNPTLHPYVIAYTYKILKPFSPKLTLIRAAFLVPIILSVLCIIAAFFIGRKIAGDVSGFFAAMVIAIHPFFLSRTFGSDTDIYNVLFPLLIIWFFVEAFEAKDAKRGLIYAGIAGIFTGIFSFVWLYWYVFDFILAAIGCYLVYYVIVHWKGFNKILNAFDHPSIKKLFMVTLVYIVLSGIFVTIFASFNVFIGGFTAPLGFVSIKDSARADLWPNVYTTVAELNASNWDGVVGSIGGKYLLFISVVGILLTFLKKDEHGKPDMKYIFLFTIWYFATIYASFKGVRFALLLVPAFAIGIGAAAGIGYKYLKDWLSKSFSIDKRIVGTSIFILFFIIIFISPGALVAGAESTSKNSLPLVDDAWWNTLTAIKTDSKPDAIINSWWDFGHHFKYIADRAVTFDGASQNTPQAHWIGKVLLTGDEDQAIAILRMLDCGANTAFEKVEAVLKDTDESIDTVYAIISMDKERATNYLKEKGFNDAQIADVLSRTHCNPPEDYFITSEDMVGKSGVWGHFGSWNFDRSNYWMNTRGKNKEDSIKYIMDHSEYTKEDAEKLYFEISAIKDEGEANNWIAPWPSYASGPVGCSKEFGSTWLQCSNGIRVNSATHESEVPTQAGVKSLDAISYLKDGQMFEKTSTNNTMGLAASLQQTGPESYTIILMQAPLQKSIFHRLFYMNGVGLKHFKKLTEQRSINGQNIIVWKVDWEGQDAIEGQSFETANNAETNKPSETAADKDNADTSGNANTNSTGNKSGNVSGPNPIEIEVA